VRYHKHSGRVSTSILLNVALPGLWRLRFFTVHRIGTLQKHSRAAVSHTPETVKHGTPPRLHFGAGLPMKMRNTSNGFRLAGYSACVRAGGFNEFVCPRRMSKSVLIPNGQTRGERSSDLERSPNSPLPPLTLALRSTHARVCLPIVFSICVRWKSFIVAHCRVKRSGDSVPSWPGVVVPEGRCFAGGSHPQLAIAMARRRSPKPTPQAGLGPIRLILQNEGIKSRVSGSPPFSYPHDADSYASSRNDRDGGQARVSGRRRVTQVRRSELERKTLRRRISPESARRITPPLAPSGAGPARARSVRL